MSYPGYPNPNPSYPSYPSGGNPQQANPYAPYGAAPAYNQYPQQAGVAGYNPGGYPAPMGGYPSGYPQQQQPPIGAYPPPGGYPMMQGGGGGGGYPQQMYQQVGAPNPAFYSMPGPVMGGYAQQPSAPAYNPGHMQAPVGVQMAVASAGHEVRQEVREEKKEKVEELNEKKKSVDVAKQEKEQAIKVFLAAFGEGDEDQSDQTQRTKRK